MDRVLSLLAAIVGLVALGASILVYTSGAAERHQFATEIAQLKASISLLGPPQPASARTPADFNDGTVEGLLALQTRVAALETAARAPAVVETADTQQVAALTPETTLAAGGSAVGDGPTKDCIPVGTRFMATPGDSFPICKTRLVLKVPAIFDGVANIGGIGDVAEGATVEFGKGCTLALLSANSAGFAEMRVSCA
jgi:hypothetical protein